MSIKVLQSIISKKRCQLALIWWVLIDNNVISANEKSKLHWFNQWEAGNWSILTSLMVSDWFVSSFSIPSLFSRKNQGKKSLKTKTAKYWHAKYSFLKVDNSYKISMHLKITNFEREEINFAVHQDSGSKPDTVFAPSQGGGTEAANKKALSLIFGQSEASSICHFVIREELGCEHLNCTKWKYQFNDHYDYFEFAKTCTWSRMISGDQILFQIQDDKRW